MSKTIAITSTFTAEPVEDSLVFWMQELEMNFKIEFAPYNQVFQQLLDPFSLLLQNQKGINIILLRFEDWQRFDHSLESTQKIEDNVQDLVIAIKSALSTSTTPYIICLCPVSASAKTDIKRMTFFQKMEDFMISELSNIPNLYIVGTQQLNTYPVHEYYDIQRDELGHIPFTPTFFTALGTVLARNIYTITSPPHKVIVLDCDHTLWKGVVGEDGVMGVEITSGWKALQALMVNQQKAGMLICLCSKNNESDVWELFEQRSDMILKQEHIVSWRINWHPKSENIKSLATELNLGLDSFIFIDDNPLECAEVQANCPEVLTIQLPTEGDHIQEFIKHIWVFDILKVTEEDKQRTVLYKQNLERERFIQESPTITDFLAGLGLNIDISVPSSANLSRISQLTQRTNQFNFTTIRRSESEIQQLLASGWECRIVEVRDRFGDYGLVGVLIFSSSDEAIKVDTFLLSCRVLGRGVEHRMLTYLAEIAEKQNLLRVDLTYNPTNKNKPALNFLDTVAANFKQSFDNSYHYHIPVEFATVSYQPQKSQSVIDKDIKTNNIDQTVVTTNDTTKSTRINKIATELTDANRIFNQIKKQQRRDKVLRPNTESSSFVAPQTQTEKNLVNIWERLLGKEPIGIHDNYFDIGGTSLLAVEIFVEIQHIFSKKLPLTTLIETPTIAQLANLLDDSDSSQIRESIVLLRAGQGKPPLFLIHDGDGETMLYRNLARLINAEHSVYGIQPYSRNGYPMLHTRITDMVNYYIEKIRSVQPDGPYLLGGMCAGGVLAFEIAQQLQRQDQKVLLVALIDAADVKAPKRIGRISSNRLNSFSESLNPNQKLKYNQRILYILNKVRQKVFNLIVYETRTKIRNIKTKVKLGFFRHYLDVKLPLPKFLQNISVRDAYQFAEAEHTPEGIYQGKVVLFRATKANKTQLDTTLFTRANIDDEPYVNIYSDPLLGWGKRVSESVIIYDIPGGHSSMLQEPNVQVMAEKMQTYIDTVISDDVSS